MTQGTESRRAVTTGTRVTHLRKTDFSFNSHIERDVMLLESCITRQSRACEHGAKGWTWDDIAHRAWSSCSDIVHETTKAPNRTICCNRFAALLRDTTDERPKGELEKKRAGAVQALRDNVRT